MDGAVAVTEEMNSEMSSSSRSRNRGVIAIEIVLGGTVMVEKVFWGVTSYIYITKEWRENGKQNSR